MGRIEVIEGEIKNVIVDMYGGDATWDLEIVPERALSESIESLFMKYEGRRVRITIEELPEIEEEEDDEYYW